jgi:DNA invertase Pin-like site-specific DNA recombinase
MCPRVIPTISTMFPVIAWRAVARSLQHLTGLLADLHSKGCDLYLHQQGVDTTTPSGKAMFQMMGVFAEFEREMIRDRVNASLDRARAEGKRLGRPPVPPVVERKVRKLRSQGLSLAVIARRVELSKGKVHAICAA